MVGRNDVAVASGAVVVVGPIPGPFVVVAVSEVGVLGVPVRGHAQESGRGAVGRQGQSARVARHLCSRQGPGAPGGNVSP